MANPNTEKTNYSDINGSENNVEETVNARPATRSEVAYRNGYVSGRVTENNLQRQNQEYKEERRQERANENAARGLLIGIIATSAIALAVGAVFFASYLNREGDTNLPTIISVPESEKTEEDPQQKPEKETTIIERTVEKTQEVVPIPEAQPPASSAPNVEVNTPAPNVEVNVPAPPNPEPANAESQPTEPQSQNQQNPPQEPPSGNAESSAPTTPQISNILS